MVNYVMVNLLLSMSLEVAFRMTVCQIFHSRLILQLPTSLEERQQ